MQLSRRRIEGAQALALHYKTSFMSFNLSNVGEFSGVEFSRTVSELKKKRERERERKKERKKERNIILALCSLLPSNVK